VTTIPMFAPPRNQLRMLRKLLLLGMVALLALCASTRPALAQPAPPPTAQDLANYKIHFDTAKKLLKSQAPDVAATEFEAAYASVHNPDALRAALDAYKQLNDAAKETITARHLLDAHPKELKLGEKKTLEALVATLAPGVGQLDLKTEVGAAIKIDSVDFGIAPLTTRVILNPGPHKLSIRKVGFEPYDGDFAILGGQTATVTPPLEKEITSGKVTVTEKMASSISVLVDGNVVGPAPWTGDLSLGTHQVSGHSDTMDAPAQSVEVVKRKEASVVLVATATTGTLEVSTADGKGIIYVDDKVAGEGKASTAVTIGPHKIRVTREGYLNAERDVDVKAGSTVSLGVELERMKPTGPPPPDYNNAEGIYGGLSFAGLLQAGQTGNQMQRRCTDFGATASCSSDTEKGGGLFGFIGYTWRYFGLDLFLGGAGDTSHPSFTTTGPNAVSGSWDVSRFGGLGALRARTSVQTRVIRASLAVGMGVSERVVSLSGSSTDYTSLLGLVDASFALRTSPTTAIALGCVGIWEDAGQGAVVVVSQSTQPFYLFSGPQYLIQPYIGLQFGP
jgi:hypothetical protein